MLQNLIHCIKTISLASSSAFLVVLASKRVRNKEGLILNWWIPNLDWVCKGGALTTGTRLGTKADSEADRSGVIGGVLEGSGVTEGTS